MSTKKLGQKALFLIFLILFFSLLSSSLRQILVYFHTNARVTEKQKELKQLEEENRALKVRFEEVQSPKFLDEQARKLLGVGDAKGVMETTSTHESETPEMAPLQNKVKELSNPEKWLSLFLND